MKKFKSFWLALILISCLPLVVWGAFPSTLTNAVDGVTEIFASHLNNMEAKVGVNNSSVTTSLDYMLRHGSSIDPGHKHTPPYGGTGIYTYAIGDLLYAPTTSTLGRLAGVATGNAIISGGVNTAPAWGKVALTTHISGVLPVANGGTNIATYAIGDLLYASTTGVLSKLPDVAVGSVLVSGGVTTAPAWSAAPTLTTSLTVPTIIAPAASLALKPTTDGTAAIQLQDKDGNSILNVDTTNNMVGFGIVAPLTLGHFYNATEDHIHESGNNSTIILESSTAAAVGVGPVINFKGQTGNATALFGFAAIRGAKDSATAESFLGRLSFYASDAGGSGSLPEVMRISGTGTVTMPLYGAGTATFSAAGVISSVSDERLKNIQGPMTQGLDAVMALTPILYKWNDKAGMGKDNTIYPGFSAQEVQKVIPEAIGVNKEGMLSLQDRGIIGALVNAVKEQQAQIEELKARLN